MADNVSPQEMAPNPAPGQSIDFSTELKQVEDALTIAWMFLNAVIVFLMQVCRQNFCHHHSAT